jgi:hypothetical protein
VVLDLYNSAGRRVLRRELGLLEAGSHSAAMNLSRVPSGIYFLELNGQVTERILRVP